MLVDPLLRFLVVDVPPGRVLLVATSRGLARVVLGPEDCMVGSLEQLSASRDPLAASRGSPLLTALAGSLRRYFLGRRVDFSQVPLDLAGSTAFQTDVWRLAAQIPYGSVRSYGWLAARLEGRGCARAVGQALARNPVPVVVPCHRVIEESGARGGFTAGDAWKGLLLELEGGEQRLRLRERKVRRPAVPASFAIEQPGLDS
ncbi:methylated-DNA--[protein]-cysteine S-methyltransferase [Candidatus Fermentibacteria bacterium]|nr:methylated-DNA--[protein]-cysteine S-methyltransferase [Candidatus Fermentibacteria bacterium]